MKHSFLNIALFFAFIFFISNCAVSKKSKTNTKANRFTENTAPPIAIDKANRKNFFKNSDAETQWVDSIYSTMSVAEKIGQLFMVSAYSNRDTVHENEVTKLVEDYKVGGIIFFQGGPVRQARLTNKYQAQAKVPLFIGLDAEWGLSMRLDSTYVFPWNMTLGAIQDLDLIETLGKQLGAESKRMGIHFNFAPVIDINTNPKNPVIGNRSFGENKINVANKAIALMKGVQAQGVYCTGKHFPGHGDTATDSHYTLPLVDFSKERIDSLDLYPYKRMFDEGLVSVMVAHLNIPSLETKENYPSSASYNVVTNILQHELGFDGLIFTDGLAMKGASDFKAPGDLELSVFLAGNDILLCPVDVPVAINKLVSSYNEGVISEARLAQSVKKILHYKFKAGLNTYKPLDLTNLHADINPTENEALHYKLYENAITVLKNDNDILPIKNLDQKIAYVKLGDDTNSTYLSALKKYAAVTEVKHSDIDSLNNALKTFDLVIIGFHKSNKVRANQDFTETELLWLEKIAAENKVILNIFTKPYTLLPITNFEAIEGLVVSYQNSEISQVVSAQLLFGAIGSKGKLPVSINNSFYVNEGLLTQKLNRTGFTAPTNDDANTND
ncbi:MAG: glycoside hydrolase family 3 C-terminal domain-containing protein [Confluentibacter sp.]|nr:glycoside hydrolase family 3 C-terminal domain-containing protein [Confluentibacter sp.]